MRIAGARRCAIERYRKGELVLYENKSPTPFRLAVNRQKARPDAEALHLP